MGRGLEPAGVDLQARGFREYINKLIQIEKQQRAIFDQQFKGAGLSYNRIVSEARKYEQQLGNTSRGAAKFGASSVAAGNLAAGAILKLIDIVVQAEAALVRLTTRVVTGGIELNKQAELSGLVLGNVFNDPQLGQAAVKFTNELAAQFRINRTEAAAFAESILPRTGGIEEFTELLRFAAIQARLTGQPLERLTFSIREALSGDWRSLRDRFDLPREQIRRIQALAPELGLAGALAKVLGDEFARLGKTNISGALSSNIGDIQARFIDLQAILGESSFDVLKASSADFLNLLNNNKEVLTFVAEQLGLIAAQAIEFVTSGVTDFLGEIDFSNVLELVDAIARAANSAELLIDVLFGVRNTNEDIQNLTSGTESFAGALFRTAEVIAVIKARLAEASATAHNLATIFQVAIGQISREEASAKFQDPAEAFKQSIEESIPAFDAYGQRLEEQNKLIAERGTRTRTATQAEKDRIDEILKARAAEDALAQAAEDQAKAFAEAVKQAEKLQLSFTRAAEDAARQQARQVAKQNRDQFKERQKLLNQQAKEFDDFNADQAEAVAEAEKDLAKEREQANKERVREQDKLFRELRQAQDRFNLDRIQSERRFNLDERRLRAEGDILGLQQLREDFALQEQEAAENFDLQQRHQGEDAKDQEQQQNEQRQERVQAAEQELRDLQDSFAEKQAEFLRGQDEQFQALLETQAEQRLASQQSFAEQEEDRRISQQRQLEDLGRSLAEQESITAEGAAAIAQQIEEAFGVEGIADQIMTGFTTRQESAFQKLFESIAAGAKTAMEQLEALDVPVRDFGRPLIQTAGGRELPGFQYGGSFTVGGTGGADSQLVAFRGTPGERVTVTPQQQQTFRMPIAAPGQVSVNFGGRSQIDVTGLEGASQETVDRAVEQMIEIQDIAIRRILRRHGVN